MHEHTAELEAMHSVDDIQQTSPRFNYPDGVWNNGEGFGINGSGGQEDTGGYFAIDDGSNITLGHVHAHYTPAWGTSHNAAISGTVVHRFIGHLAPTATDPNEAAFEVFAPTTWDDQQDTVILLSTWATLGDARPSRGGRHGYLGSPPDGLIVTISGGVHRPPPWSDYVAGESGTAEAHGYNIVAAYIVSPVGGRDLMLTMQRTLQLERAVQLMLDQGSGLRPPAMSYGPGSKYQSGEPTDWPVVVAGGSSGGQVAQLLPAFYPDRFAGGVAASFSASTRRTVGNQQSFRFAATSMGFNAHAVAYDERDTLTWSKFYREAGASYYQGAFLSLWKRGKITRPEYFLYSDEDNVTNGIEWRSVLGGGRSYSKAGEATNATTGAKAFWSVMDKACHDDFDYTVPAGLHYTSSATVEQVVHNGSLHFLGVAVNAWASSTPSRPVIDFPEGSDHDPYDHVLMRGPLSQRQPPAGTPTLLEPDETFQGRSIGANATQSHHRGLGTGLGFHESLLIHGPNIYVGSADGVVSRLYVNFTTLELEVQAQSESLGYGAWAMDVTQDDHLIVGTYGAIHKLDEDCTCGNVSFPLGFEHSGPRRLEVVQNLFGAGGEHVIFVSWMGHLVVLDAATLQLVDDVSEPGIWDFEVGDSIRPGASSKPIYLQSQRGHVIKIEICADSPECLTGSTEQIVGRPTDLMSWDDSGTQRMVALYSNTEDDSSQPVFFDTIKEISMAHGPNAVPGGPNMSIVSEFSNAGNVGAGYSADEGFIGRIRRLPSANGYLVMRGSLVHYVSDSGTEFTRNLGGVVTTHYAMDMQVGDIAPSLPPHPEEVVFATESGHVVWFPAAVFVSPAYDWLWSTIVSKVNQDPHAYSSASIVATWGMTVDDATDTLQVIDQNARRWEIAGDGATVFRGVVRTEADPNPSHGPISAPATKPFRDLVKVPYDPGQGGVGQPVTGASNQRHLKTGYHVPSDTALVFVRPPTYWAGVQWLGWPHDQTWIDDYMPFTLAGDTLTIHDAQQNPIENHSCWWTGFIQDPDYRNLVRQATWTSGQTGVVEWATATRSGGLATPLASHCRSPSPKVSFDQQSLRYGFWSGLGETAPKIVATTTGGGLMVLDPMLDPEQGQDPLVQELDPDAGDHGFGAMALCVTDLVGDGKPWIIMGTLEHHAGTASGERDMVSSLHLYERIDATPTGLVERHRYVFDSAAGGPVLYGLCGIAVGDVDGTPGNELVLTTLNGDLVVYALTVSGTPDVQLGSLLHRSVHEGALGVSNSIVIADLDPNITGNEVYVAGSMGIRKFKLK